MIQFAPVEQPATPTQPAAPKPIAHPDQASAWQPLSDKGRWLALLMQVKDTGQIMTMLLDGSLLFGIVFGVGLPGLLLYVLRWRQLRRPVGRFSILAQAALSLIHEVFWACVFQKDTGSDPITQHSVLLAGLYWLGAALMGIQLLLVACNIPGESYTPDPAHEQNPSEETQNFV